MTRVLILVALVVVGYALIEYREYAECSARYDDQQAAAIQARSAAADRDRAAEDAMWQAFADATDPNVTPPDKAQKYAQDAFLRFLQERQAAKDDRAKHPLPSGPSTVCR